jgi:hypothetical protein
VPSNVVFGLFLKSLIFLPSRNPKLSQDVSIFLELAIDDYPVQVDYEVIVFPAVSVEEFKS